MTDLPTDPSEREALLRERLTPLQFEVTQKGGTERAFTGTYWDNHDDGTFHCIVCDTPLFSSDTKYESGSGWPSFWHGPRRRRRRDPHRQHPRHGPHRGRRAPPAGPTSATSSTTAPSPPACATA